MPVNSALKATTALGNLPVLVATFDNYISDLVPITFNGATVLVDFGRDDVLNGTSGRDIASVHTGNDTVYAGEGNDVMHDLVSGNDRFYGEGGHDWFVLGAGNDYANGGSGIDTLDYTKIDFTVIADLQSGFIFAEGIDTVEQIENIRGSVWNDTLMGSAFGNEFFGNGGNDTLRGRGGSDYLNGGVGDDKMYGDEIYQTSAGGNDNLFGESGKDTMHGGGGNDYLHGGTHDDTLNGSFGNDTLIGGLGKDILRGGQGADKFVFTSTNDFGLYDKIVDFQKGIDKIDLSGIDANPLLAGNQAFEFDRHSRSTDYDSGVISARPGPVNDGDVGHVDWKVSGGNTYIYVQTSDNPTGAHIVLTGVHLMTASDFIL